MTLPEYPPTPASNWLHYLLEAENLPQNFQHFYEDSRFESISIKYLNECLDYDSSLLKKANETASLALKDKGNDMLKKKNYFSAIDYYNKSLIFASEEDNLYPLIFANRGLCLMKLNEFEKAISDLELSIRFGYPSRSLDKVYRRLAHCYCCLGNPEKTGEFTKLTFQQLEINGQNDIDDLEKELQLCKVTVISAAAEANIPDDSIIDIRNDRLDGGSSLVSLHYSDDFGRHVVASKNLKKNDLLFAETPFAFVTLFFDKNDILASPIAGVCDFCGTSNIINFIKCNGCSLFYCNDICKRNAWKRSHKYECKLINLDILPNVGVGFLALRTLLIAVKTNWGITDQELSSLRARKDITSAMQVIDYLKDVTMNTKLLTGYLKVFNLLDHVDKMSQADRVQYSLTCVMLTTYLSQYTDFTSKILEKLPSHWETNSKQVLALTNILLLQHIGQIICNAQTIYEPSDGTAIGIGLYPSISMMNHSCISNISMKSAGSKLIVRANEDINESEQIFNCYIESFEYTEDSQNRREHLLFQYNFECNCKLCKGHLRK